MSDVATTNGGNVALAGRIAARGTEIEQAILTRVHAVGEDSSLDPAYLDGLRGAVSAALEYAIAAVELGEDRASAPPPALLSQTRLAARLGIALETVLRRYVVGNAVLSDFLVEEAENAGLHPVSLQSLLRSQAALFDRLLGAIAREHRLEERHWASPARHNRGERIERLLAGERIDADALQYDLDMQHVGVVAAAPNVERALRKLATALDCRLLSLPRDDGSVWAWLGSSDIVAPAILARVAAGIWPAEASLAFGEPKPGLSGWRLTHRQARAAHIVALRGSVSPVHYADVALPAAVIQDDLLATSLHELYLSPLEEDRDNGKRARETLRAYFASERNISSAAASLGVSRQAVSNRLRTIEQRLNRTLNLCAFEVEIALRCERLGILPNRNFVRD